MERPGTAAATLDGARVPIQPEKHQAHLHSRYRLSSLD